MREFLKGLDLDKDTINTIMAEHGKLITEAKEKNESLEDKVKTYEAKIDELNSKAKDSAEIQKELDTLKTQIAEEKKQKEQEDLDNKLTANVLEAIEGKDFVNERTKNAIINEIKTALQDKANVGKSAKEIFEDITKDSTDIFKSENEITNEVPGVKEDLEKANNTKQGEIKFNSMFKTYN